jgi:hypothetical protein
MFSLLTMFASSESISPPLLQKDTTGENVRLNTVPTAAEMEETNYLPLLYFILGGSVAIVTLAAYELRKRRSLKVLPAATPSRDQ